MTISVLIADDQAMVRSGLRLILEDAAGHHRGRRGRGRRRGGRAGPRGCGPTCAWWTSGCPGSTASRSTRGAGRSGRGRPAAGGRGHHLRPRRVRLRRAARRRGRLHPQGRRARPCSPRPSARRTSVTRWSRRRSPCGCCATCHRAAPATGAAPRPLSERELDVVRADRARPHQPRDRRRAVHLPEHGQEPPVQRSRPSSGVATGSRSPPGPGRTASSKPPERK